jgi:uncharacterized protein
MGDVDCAPGYSARVRRLFDVRSPMRDGIELSCDVWLPAGEGRYPVILMRTPYLKTLPAMEAPTLARFFADRGYIVAIQDVRGRGDSHGEFTSHFQEADDGYDTVEWLAGQPWCNGRVGMMGPSYLGVVQWLAASREPPHLVCIASTAAPGEYLNETPYVGGAFLHLGSLQWHNAVSGAMFQNDLADDEWESVLKHRPLLTADEALGRRMPLYRELLMHPTLDDHWKRILLTDKDYRNIAIPALHITGWFDGDQPGAMYHWHGMARHSPAAAEQYLIVGPWTHQQTFFGGEKRVGELEFSGASIVDVRRTHLEFFDCYLKGATPGFDRPRVSLYVTGRNEWCDFDVYPVPGTAIFKLYLSSRGRANSLCGDGWLSEQQGAAEPQDHYDFDPANPVPLNHNVPAGVFAADRRALERRDDVLVYTGEAQNARMTVIGAVTVELHAASDARDTDFTASLIDVFPDGRAVVLGPRVVGIIRARYRHGLESTELLTPGRVERYRIDLGHVAHSFEPGHRIRLEVSSSAAPTFNPNQNTGNLVATDVEWRIARQTIFHDATHPSALLLPVLKPRV